MTDVIRVEKINEVHMKVISDAGILQEISDFFSFRPANYKFNPKYKARVWDGYIRLITPFKPFLYIGLLDQLKEFSSMREYKLEIDPLLSVKEEIPDNYGYDLAKEIGIKLTLRDYQNEYIVNAIRNSRSLSLSPTSSGKSLMIFLIQQYYWRLSQKRTLIIVPTIQLVHQMAGDFIDYGCDPENIYKIQGGVDKNTEAPITISTWQSLQKQPKEWFDQFGVVMGDEAHLFTAKSLISILEKCTEAEYRFGFTGTISDDSKCLDKNSLILTNRGKVKISDLNVGDLVYSYNEETEQIELKPVVRVMNNGNKKNLIKIITKSGSINVTEDHKIYTQRGWIMAKDLTKEDRIAKIIIIDKIEFDEITSIEKIEYNDDVFDIEVKDNHNYFANNHLVHNCHRLVLSGLFGPIKKYVSTKNLIDSGTVATFNIKALVLKYPKEMKKNFRINLKKIQKEKRFHAEKEFIVNNEKRNLFIRNLVWSLEGQNNLILFELVEKHGKVLEPLLRKEDRHLHFIHGDISGEERERIRHLVENDPQKNHNILASFGTFSTGSNLKKLDNLILASGSKSEIRILQSIGRTLRKGNGSDKATLYDIADDLSEGSFSNYTLEHFKKRIDIYGSEQFPFKIYDIDLYQ